MSVRAVEINLDGIVGPTHNYAGLAWGNVASMGHRHAVANPRGAALEGLGKMKLLLDLGVRQGVLLPQERPEVGMLRRVGFSGSDGEVVARAGREAPEILAACASASAMWAANSATVSPSSDTADGRVHITPANLAAQFHRALETPTTARLLRRIFPEESGFVHHPPLPRTGLFADEGAANQMRLSAGHGERGVEVFVYGREGYGEPGGTEKFPARQTREAAEAVARLHGLAREGVMVVRQNPAAIAAGVFHNDVIAVANENVLLYHAEAFVETGKVVEELQRRLEARGTELVALEVKGEELTVEEAVASYLFNSQMVSVAGGGMALIAPMECQRMERARRVIERWVAKGRGIREVHYVEVRQSMQNGGGPACLRLRVVLTEGEAARMHQGVMLTPELYGRLRGWVERHYREQVGAEDLADPRLLEESRRALEELTGMVGMGGGQGGT